MRKLLQSVRFPGIADEYVANGFFGGELLPTGADLNSYLDPCNYIGEAPSVGTYSNCPNITTGFRFMVIEGYNQNHFIQIVIDEADIYFRSVRYTTDLGNPVYSAWKKVMTNILSSSQYGEELPETGTEGQLFFQLLA